MQCEVGKPGQTNVFRRCPYVRQTLCGGLRSDTRQLLWLACRAPFLRAVDVWLCISSSQWLLVNSPHIKTCIYHSEKCSKLYRLNTPHVTIHWRPWRAYDPPASLASGNACAELRCIIWATTSSFLAAFTVLYTAASLCSQTREPGRNTDAIAAFCMRRNERIHLR